MEINDRLNVNLGDQIAGMARVSDYSPRGKASESAEKVQLAAPKTFQELSTSLEKIYLGSGGSKELAGRVGLSNIADKYGLDMADLAKTLGGSSENTLRAVKDDPKFLEDYDKAVAKTINSFKVQGKELLIEDRSSGTSHRISKQTVLKAIFIALTSPHISSGQGGIEMEVDSERFLVKKSGGQLLMARMNEAVELDQGNYSKASLVMNVTVGQLAVLKTIREDRLHQAAKAKTELANEDAKLAEIHKDGPVRGIKDRPHAIVDLMGKTGPVYGFLETRYQSNLADFIQEAVMSSNDDDQLNKNLLDGCHQLLSGLAHLDKINLRHGDIKPQNILARIDANGNWEVHLADFGGAKFFSEIDVEKDPEIQEHYFGTTTRAFMPPEDVNLVYEALEAGNQKGLIELEKKRDVFAMGMSLFYLLRLDYPYQPGQEGFPDTSGGFDGAGIKKILGETKAADAMIELLEGMLKPDPAQRLSAPQALEKMESVIDLWQRR